MAVSNKMAENEDMKNEKLDEPAFSSGLRSMKTTHRPTLMLRCKVVVVGDACVGKTALVQLFQQGTYPKNYLMTSWVDFSVKQLYLKEINNHTGVEMYLFDCAGQSIFNQVEENNQHFENASFVMVVYDVANKASFDNVKTWLSKVQSRRPQNSSPLPGVLVANKVDLRRFDFDSRAVISKSQGVQLAKRENLTFFETSAAQQTDADAPFKYIATEFHRKYQETVQRAEQLSMKL